MSKRKGRERARTINRHVGAMIRLYRVDAGLSQTDLAAELDVSFQQLQKYERGANRVSAGGLYVIAEVTGRDITDFFPKPDGAAPETRARADLETVKSLGRITESAEARSEGGSR